MRRRINGAGARGTAVAMAIGVAAVVALPANGPASADRGDLDPTFGGTGQVRSGVISSAGQGFAVAVDPIEDRVYIGAIEHVSPFGPHQAYVAAFTSDGALDASFGTGGVVRTGIAASADAGVGLGVSPDGQRVYLTTFADDGEFDDESYVAAFTAGGALDLTFSDDGVASTGLRGSPEGGYALAVEPTSGRVYIAAHHLLAAGDTLGQQYVAAFAPNGQLDPGFSGDGVTLGGPGYFRGGFALALDPENARVYLASSLSTAPPVAIGGVAAWNSDGTIATEFGSTVSGFEALPLPVEPNGRWGLAVDPDRDRIYVASYEASSGPTTYPFVAGLSADGELDTTFGVDGFARTIHAGTGYSGQSVAVDPADGTVFLITYSNAGIFPSHVYVAAFTPGGVFDETFGDAGRATTGLGSGSEAGSRGVFDPATGRLYVVSYAGGDGLGALLSAFDTVDALPQLSIADVSQPEGTGLGSTFQFEVSLNEPAPAGGVTFDIATADDTASAVDGDYSSNSLTGQTIPAGASTYTFSVDVNSDAESESDEDFFVNVTNVTGADVLDGQAVGTILDDDTPAEVLITPTTGLTTTEAGGGATFDVVLRREPTDAVTVELASSDLTEGTVGPLALTFDSANWATPQTVTVTGVDDDDVDGPGAFSIVLSVRSADPAYAALVIAPVSVVNVDDDAAAPTTTSTTTAPPVSTTTAPPVSTTTPPAPTPPPTAPPTTSGPITGLPETGGSPLGTLALAAALLGLGLTAVLGARAHTRRVR